MRVVIAGISGYIGSALCEKLIADNIEVITIGRSEPSFLHCYKKITHYHVDVTAPIKIKFSKSIDFFIHLASANEIDSNIYGNAVLINTLGTKNCLDLCINNNIKNFIYFSTFHVYGKLSGTISETTPPSPLNDYSITHFFAEEYVRMYHENNNINYVILRPTNIFGSPIHKKIDRWTLVPGCFCKELIENNTITLKSSGKQLRDYCSLNDILNCTFSIMNNYNANKNKIINISSGINYSILEIAQLTKSVFENNFHRNTEIKILSNQPIQGELFHFDRKIINKIYGPFQGKKEMATEIEKTFKLLI